MNSVQDSILDNSDTTEKYVGFIDLLGFSSKVTSDFESSLEFYNEVLRSSGITRNLFPDVRVTIYSDSFLLVCEKLGPMVGATQAILMQTMFSDCLVRGGIAYGKHTESHDGANLFVVSEALVKAATVEKQVKHPCVAIHDEIEIPNDWWSGERNLDRGILYFGGLRIVNPCNKAWGQSAAMRVAIMLDEYPQHSDKFKWFLELHDSIFSPVPMVPPRLLSGVEST